MTNASNDEIIDNARKNLLNIVKPLFQQKVHVYKNYKIIHDPIWGSCRFEPWEVSLFDLPLFQRLRGLKQTGFA
jgi:hypothetical protein